MSNGITRTILTVNTALPPMMQNIAVPVGMELPKVEEQVIINSAKTITKLGVGRVTAVNAAARTYDVEVLH